MIRTKIHLPGRLSFLLSLVLSGYCLAILVWGLWDIRLALEHLSNTPGTSGIDHFGIGWQAGIDLFAVSVFSLIVSSIAVKRNLGILQHIAKAELVLSALFLVTAVILFYL